MKRREFVSGLALAAGATACSQQAADCEPGVATPGETFEWNLATSWPPGLPGLGVGVENLASRIQKASNGRLKIKVFASGELVPALEVLDAVSRGTVQMGHDSAYYHRGKIPAAQYFTAIPYGHTVHEINAWMYYGGGLELWRELYEPLNVIPFPAGNTGVQMAGWFNKEINSLEDLQGLKMRIPGLGGEVLKRAGGVPVSMAGSEIYTAMQTGVIDATEWVGPYNDLAMGLQDVARYYYYPGWHEPGPTLEAIVNKAAWDSLPEDLQRMVEVAAAAANEDLLSEFTARNASALKTLLSKHNVELRRLPDDVLAKLKVESEAVVVEATGDSDLARRIRESYGRFLSDVREYHAISEQAYINAR